MPAPLKRIAIPTAVAALCSTAFLVSAHQSPPAVHLTVLPPPPPAAPAAPAGGTATLRQALASMNVLPSTYTVRPGDTLTSIAARHYGRPDAWPVLYWANDREIRWANEITAGQVLVIPAEPARIPAAPPQLAPVKVPSPVLVAAYAPAQATTVSATGESAFEACVIRAESGGDPTAVNPTSGAGGVFQFLPSTWESLGYSGLPEDAPVAEQYAAFSKLYAEAGTSPWSSDGCLRLRIAGHLVSG